MLLVSGHFIKRVRAGLFDRKYLVIGLCVVAIIIGMWRLANPPIHERLSEQLSRAEDYERACVFDEAFRAYRQALTLDGSNRYAIIGLRRVEEAQESVRVGIFLPGCTWQREYNEAVE